MKTSKKNIFHTEKETEVQVKTRTGDSDGVRDEETCCVIGSFGSFAVDFNCCRTIGIHQRKAHKLLV